MKWKYGRFLIFTPPYYTGDFADKCAKKFLLMARGDVGPPEACAERQQGTPTT